MTEFTENPEVLVAVEDTLDMYERMLIGGKKEFDEWDNTDCRVCAAMNNKCQSCPFYSAELGSCGSGPGPSLLGGKSSIAIAGFASTKTSIYKRVVKARYAELLRRLKVNGYEYK